jgi:ParB family chromosome partitioning protein
MTVVTEPDDATPDHYKDAPTFEDGIPEVPGANAPVAKKAAARLLPADLPIPEEARVDLSVLPAALAGPEPSPAMIASVRAVGILEPILLVRKGQKLVVAAGRRRIAAARAAEQKDIPARIYTGVNPNTLALLENELREANPLAELEAIQALMKLSGITEEEISEQLGIRLPRVRMRLRLATHLAPALLVALKRGEIGVRVAAAAAKLSPAHQESLVLTLEENGKLTGDDVAMAKRVRTQNAAASLPDLIVPRLTHAMLATQLRTVARTAQSVQKLGGDDIPPSIQKAIDKLAAVVADWTPGPEPTEI